MKRVVMAFGAFDGIHQGHLYYLNEAKKLGTYLIVSIARDHPRWSITDYKNTEQKRKKFVQTLHVADKVILGSTTDALKKIKEINPDIIAITEYHPVDADILRYDLKRKGIHAKVIVIKKFKPKLFDTFFSLSYNKRNELINMGLTPKNIAKHKKQM